MEEHQVDAPAPVDADEPPPRKRGLGRGLAELTRAGSSIGTDGQPYYGLDSLMWTLDRVHAKRVAERTPQPKALHRLPEPVNTGELRVADIMAAATDRPAPPAPEAAKPRSLSESAAMLVRGLPGMSEALRAADKIEPPRAADKVIEQVAAPALAQESVPPQESARKSKWAFLEDDDA